MTLDQLREALEDVSPVVKRGQVVELWRDAETEDEKEVSKELGFICGWVEEHPEGADRGGYVPYAEFQSDEGGLKSHGPVRKAYWDVVDGGWRVS